MIISLQYSFVCRNLIRETIPSITAVHTDDVIDDRAGLFVVGSVYEKDKLNYSYLFSKLSFKTAGWSYVDTVSENVFEKDALGTNWLIIPKKHTQIVNTVSK